jgi:DNA-binding MarR family transcriptional regulator
MSDPAISRNVLLALRQIIRAMDIRSRELERMVGLTVPQLVVLKQVSEDGESPIGRIAKQVSLSQATVTTIVDRLALRGLIRRERDDSDRRRVMIALTDAGAEILERSPAILQEQFLERFAGLESWEQTQMLATLQRIAAMMDAHTLPAAPILGVDELAVDPD